MYLIFEYIFPHSSVKISFVRKVCVVERRSRGDEIDINHICEGLLYYITSRQNVFKVCKIMLEEHYILKSWSTQ